MNKKQLLSKPIEHIDITSFDSRTIIDQMGKMSFSARDLSEASRIYNEMLQDDDCTIFVTLAGSTSAAGCMQIYRDMIKYNMVDVVVSTGAMLMDQDFHEALGYKHYQGSNAVDDLTLGKLMIDRIYQVFIDEEELKGTDETIYEIAKEYAKCTTVCSSRQFIKELGRWLNDAPGVVKNSLLDLAHQYNVPIFSPAFSDCSAGFGLVKLQEEKESQGDVALYIDSVSDFRELTKVKIASKRSGIVIIGGGVPKNFTMDSVICSEVLGQDSPPFDYAIQLSVADPRDGALSGSELRELNSWRKAALHESNQATVFGELTMGLPLMMSDVYHRGHWQNRKRKEFSKLFKD